MSWYMWAFAITGMVFWFALGSVMLLIAVAVMQGNQKPHDL